MNINKCFKVVPTIKSSLISFLLLVTFYSLLITGINAGTVNLPQTGQKTSYIANDDGDLRSGVEWPDPRFTDNGDGTITDNLTGLMWLQDGGCFSLLKWSDESGSDSIFDVVARFNTGLGSFELDCAGYTAGYTDWRVPNMLEQESLLNFEEANSADWLNLNGFVNIAFANISSTITSYQYWTSTTDAEDNEEALMIFMSSGSSRTATKDVFNQAFLLVRSTNLINSAPAKLWKSGQTDVFAEGDDGDLQQGVAWPSPRFVDNEDGTVTDKLTRLVWLKDASCFGKQIWEDSFPVISIFNRNPGSFGCEDYTATHSDWKVPNIKELRSLWDHSKFGPALSLDNLFLNVDGQYWSSNTSANSDWGFALYISSSSVVVAPNRPKDEEKLVWPVRLSIDSTIQVPTPQPTASFTPMPTDAPVVSPSPTKEPNITPTVELTPMPTTEPTTEPEPTPIEESPPEADFKANPTLGAVPLNVQFTDTSEGGPTGWFWEFGNGNTSAEQNPSNVYNQAGLFNITLEVSNSLGRDVKEKAEFISVKEVTALQADFTADPIVGFVPLNVKFTDLSIGNPTSWIWTFGDGGQSSDRNPTHEYLREGIFTTDLTVTRTGETSTEKKVNFISVIENRPIAEFKASSTAGEAPLNVTFTDLSQPVGNISNWLWSFGDGKTETEQSPAHTYNLEGFFTVALTVSNEAGADTERKTNIVSVIGQNAPVAEFSSNATVGVAPFDVQFFDQSEPVDNIANWIWDFGDGSINLEQNPSHIYSREGIFNVSLTVSNTFGADTEVKQNIISIVDTSDDVLAGFSVNSNIGIAPASIEYTNNSAGSILESLWDFGDELSSNEKEPSHTYREPGEYTVILSVTGRSSVDTEKKDRFLKIIGSDDVAAGFRATPLIGNAPVEIQFVDRSLGDVSGWLWDFGDGSTSTEQNPKHTYFLPGNYTVTLAVSGQSGASDSNKKEEFIEILKEKEEGEDDGGDEDDGGSLTVDPATATGTLRRMTAIVTATDKNGAPVSGVTIEASASTGLKVNPLFEKTDENGEAAFKFKFKRNSTEGIITFTAENFDEVTIVQK